MGTMLSDLQKGEKAKIVRLDGGYGFQRKLRIIGIKEGKIILILATQPFGGPIVVEVERRGTVIGRKMAQRIFVEVIK